MPFDGRLNELALEAHIAAQPELAGEPLLILGRQLADFEEDKDRLDILALDLDGEIVLIELKVADAFRVTDLQALGYAAAYASRTPEELANTLRRYLERLTEGASEAPGTRLRDPLADGDAVAAVQTGAPDGDEKTALTRIERPGQFRGAGGAATGFQVADPSDGRGEIWALPSTVSLEDAKARIVEFLPIDDFDEWQPSQRVRIKVIAPGFPRRVLKNVKWLGDVYDMPIEAIAARLFETARAEYHISFERLLPLPGDAEFDLTIRRREERKRDDNVARSKRPNVVPVLLAAGKLHDGQVLYVHRSVLPAPNRDLFDPDHIAFQVTVRTTEGGPAKFAWRPDDGTEARPLVPSGVAYELYKAVIPDWGGSAFASPVAVSFTVEPHGKTLADIALDEGLWSPADAVE